VVAVVWIVPEVLHLGFGCRDQRSIASEQVSGICFE